MRVGFPGSILFSYIYKHFQQQRKQNNQYLAEDS